MTLLHHLEHEEDDASAMDAREASLNEVCFVVSRGRVQSSLRKSICDLHELVFPSVLNSLCCINAPVKLCIFLFKQL